MNRALLLRVLSSAALLGTLVVNALANILPINGLTTGEVADRYPSLFTPAGFTFGIWSVIYALLIAFIIYTWIERNNEAIMAMLPWFILSCLLNMGWIVVWHYLLPAISVIIMILLLYTLTTLFRMVHREPDDSGKHKLFVRLPFSVYFSWICVATIANIAAYLSSTSWNAFALPPQLWTVLMLLIACLLSVVIFFKFRSPAVIAVVLWTLAGIFFRWRNSDYDLIEFSAPVFGAMLIVAAILSSRRRRVVG